MFYNLLSYVWCYYIYLHFYCFIPQVGGGGRSGSMGGGGEGAGGLSCSVCSLLKLYKNQEAFFNTAVWCFACGCYSAGHDTFQRLWFV